MKSSIASAISFALLSSLMTAQAQTPEGTPASPNATESNPTQTAEPSAPKPKKESKEVISVTGSRIKRVEVEGPTQIQVVTKDEMEAGGQTTVADVVRDIPVSAAGSTREESNRGAPGFSGVNLRGLGEKYTLVLIDGRRLPNDPTFDAVDIGAIPTAMIERIEILKEGAGAIYGSDAVGGVVNIITKKAFDGTSVLYSRNQPSEEGGVEDRLEAVYGKTFENGSVVASAGYRKRNKIWARDRKFVGEGWSSSGSPGSFQPVVNTGTSAEPEWEGKPGTSVQPDPRCPVNNGTSRQFSGFCQYNYESVRTLSPDVTDQSLMLKTDYRLNDNLSVYALLQNTRRESIDIIAAAPSGRIRIEDAQAVGQIKSALGSAGDSIDPAAGDALWIFYRTVGLGERETKTSDETRFATLGLSGDISGSWTWGLDYSYGHVDRKEEGTNGFWLVPAFQAAIKNGQFNPFDPNDSGAGLNSVRFTPVEEQATQIRQVSVLASGEVGELSGGPIQLAIGGSVVNEDFSSKADPEVVNGSVVGSSGSNGGGKRQIPSFYVESSLPVTKELEANLAARYDTYEKFGETVNPRLAIKYKTADLLFRTSVGTGFRAPTLQEQSTEDSSGFPAYIDAVACNAAKDALAAPGGDATQKQQTYTRLCTEQQWEYSQTASDDVKPEKALIYNVGVVYSLDTKTNVSLDWWTLQIKDTIGVPDLGELTKLEAAGNTSYLEKGITIDRVGGEIDKVTSPATNLAKTELSGLDLAATTTIGSKQSATFEYGLDASYQLYNKVAAFEGSPLVDQAGKARTPQYRMNNTFGTTFLDDHKLSLVVRSTSGTDKVNPDFGKIPSYTSLDLHYNFLGFFDGTASVGAINVTSVKPPKDDSASPTINYDLYTYAGSSYYVRLTQNF